MPSNHSISRFLSSKPYHHHHHLLIQFILFELILAQKEIEHIFEILEDESLDHQKTLELLLASLIKLSGSTQGYMRLFSWNDDSILTKLKNYCAYFCQSAGQKNRDRLNMNFESNRAWLSSLHTLDLARRFASQAEHEQLKGKNWDIGALNTSLHKTVCSIQRLARLTAKVITQFKHDENVIFFLLRHSENLDALFGENAISKMIQKMFPKRARSGVKSFLSKRYLERGFNNLIPQIHSKLEELELA